jgi:hypothetical protein
MTVFASPPFDNHGKYICLPVSREWMTLKATRYISLRNMLLTKREYFEVLSSYFQPMGFEPDMIQLVLDLKLSNAKESKTASVRMWTQYGKHCTKLSTLLFSVLLGDKHGYALNAIGEATEFGSDGTIGSFDRKRPPYFGLAKSKR